MARTVLFSNSKSKIFHTNELSDDDSNGNVILADTDVEHLIERIVNDIRTVKLDSIAKVNSIKSRITNILHFYKRGYVDENTSMDEADVQEMRRQIRRGFRRSVTGFYEKAKLDTNVIRLYDKSAIAETQCEIRKKVIDQSLTVLKDRTQKEIEDIKHNMQVSVSTTKEEIQNLFESQQLRQRNSIGSGNEDLTDKSDFEKCDMQVKKLVNKTKFKMRENMSIIFINPAGKKPPEEIESEKFIKGHLIKFLKKAENNMRSQKRLMKQGVQKVQNTIGYGLTTTDDENDISESTSITECTIVEM